MTATKDRGAPPQKSDADDRTRALRSMELRLAGMSYYKIAETLGYADESGARKAVDRMLSRKEVANCEELREVEGRRLDQLQTAHWTNALRGDVEAAKIVLQIIDRRCKLLGLNAPTRVQVGPGVTDREWAEQVSELLSVLGGPDAVAATFPAAAAVVSGPPVLDGEVIADEVESPGTDGTETMSKTSEITTSESPADRAAGEAEASEPTDSTVSPLHLVSGPQGQQSGGADPVPAGEFLDDRHGEPWSNL